MRILKNIWAQLHRFVFWALILSLLWAWIYTFVGDTTRDKKLILCVDAYALEQRPLALRLEDECLPAGIKMIQVRSFGYDFLGTELEGDLYLMKASILEAALTDTPGKLAPLTLPEGEYFVIGENADASLDSRFGDVGNIPADHILGTVWLRYAPFKDLRFLP